MKFLRPFYWVFTVVACSPLLTAEPVHFHRQVRPIFSDKCFTCHGPDAANRLTPLRLDTADGVAVELRDGKRAIVAGKPDESELYLRVASDSPARRMPPAYDGHDKLSEAEIAVIRDWIQQGAEWQGHWAFEPPRKPGLPAVKQQDWERNPIDRFVLARLEREDLKPSAEADRRRLIRRVTLDLTGLPPTPAEIDAFLADDSADAFERVVDRLLVSPHYGERMAIDWLEAARYADTHGYQNDPPRVMWRWRDWVIDSFNRNMPFDDFTVWQVAGDLMPRATREQKIATGFNRNHRGNAELGIVPAEYAVEYVVDRVDTTFTVWQGLTLGCARCHDHKYDPFTQKEFYQLYAYFNNVPDRGRYFKYGNHPPFIAAPTPRQEAELAEVDARIRRLAGKLAARVDELDQLQLRWEEQLQSSSTPVNWAHSRRLLARYPLDGGDVKVVGGEAVSAPGRLGEAMLFDGTVFAEGGDIANFSFQEPFTLSAWIKPQDKDGGIVSRYKARASARGDKGWGLFLVDGKAQLRLDSTDIDDRVQVETVQPVQFDQWQHVTAVYDGSRLAKGIAIFIDGEPAALQTLIDHSNNDIKSNNLPVQIGYGPKPDDRFVGLIDDVRIYDRALGIDEVHVIATDGELNTISETPRQKRSEGQQLKLTWAFRERYAPAADRETWRALRRLEIEREQLAASIPTVMVMEEMSPPRQAFLLKRGAYDAPGEEVFPALPAVLPPLPAGEPNNRLGLARWLVDEKNPLTARVTVNRFWQMLFGVGLVKTAENFGSQGEWPSHPQLLDWLAVEFVENGWDVKATLKLMVTSATYRQSAKLTPVLRERDPENRLLARGPRLRLPAEAIRDQALAFSGLLNRAIGGPSVKPYQPAGLWQEIANEGVYEPDEGDALYRRSLYTYWKRTIGPPALMTFDTPPRETCVVRRANTNTPLQALNLMNDVTYIEAARMLGERMIHEGGGEPDERIAFGFLLATARRPSASEGAVLRRAFYRFLDRYQTRPQDAREYLRHGEHERDESIDAPELAAYAAVAGLIINMDETITKE